QRRLQDVFQELQRVVMHVSVLRLQSKINRVQIQLGMQQAQEPEDPLQFLLKRGRQCPSNHIFGASRTRDGLQDLVGTVVPQDLPRQHRLQQLKVKRNLREVAVEPVQRTDDHEPQGRV